MGQLVLVQHKGTKAVYTMKSVSKTKVTELKQQNAVISEKQLVSSLVSTNRMVPIALMNYQDLAYLHTVYKVRVATDLHELMASTAGPLNENVARFYVACVALGLEHLHSECICYRNLSPEMLLIDSHGYIQLMDMRFAVKIDGAEPRDICGIDSYLSPEQVSGQGHSMPVDYWALGVLLWEMLTGTSPWSTGDAAKDTETAIYGRIASHKQGALNFPKSFSIEVKELLDELLDPKPEMRIGCRGGGSEELREHAWFTKFEWTEMEQGTAKAPAEGTCMEAMRVAMKEGGDSALKDKPYTGDTTWFNDFEVHTLLRG